MNNKHVGRPPLRSYLTAAMEATEKEIHANGYWILSGYYHCYFSWVALASSNV